VRILARSRTCSNRSRLGFPSLHDKDLALISCTANAVADANRADCAVRHLDRVVGAAAGWVSKRIAVHSTSGRHGCGRPHGYGLSRSDQAHNPKALKATQFAALAVCEEIRPVPRGGWPVLPLLPLPANANPIATRRLRRTDARRTFLLDSSRGSMVVRGERVHTLIQVGANRSHRFVRSSW